jgi:hypothetical protein
MWTLIWEWLPKALSILGLCIACGGAVCGLIAVRVSKPKALELGLMRLAGETDAENLKQPAVQNLLRQSRLGFWAFLLIAIGTVLQIIGVGLSS